MTMVACPLNLTDDRFNRTVSVVGNVARPYIRGNRHTKHDADLAAYEPYWG